MPSLAVLRLAKIKTMASLDRRSRHATRTQPVANADPSGQVVWLSPQADPAAAVRAMVAGLDRPPRKNAVLAVEIVATASPEWFLAGDSAAFDRSVMAWAESTFGPGRVAAAVAHDDEKVHHVHLFCCPWSDSPVKKRGRKPKDGQQGEAKPCRRLDWAGLIGTDRAALSRLQDTFAESVASLGIARGQRRSLARHTELSVWRGQQIAAAKHEATILRSAALLTEQAAAAQERDARAWKSGVAAFAAGEIVDAAGPEHHRTPVFAATISTSRRADLAKQIAAAEQAILDWIAECAHRLRHMMAAAEARAEAVLAVARRLGPAFEIEATRQFTAAGRPPEHHREHLLDRDQRQA